ncbi:MAG: hypothetical protein RL007_1200, partial [Bacteroidota bacterium]
MKYPILLTLLASVLLSCGEQENAQGETVVSAEDPEKINKLLQDELSGILQQQKNSSAFTIGKDTITALPQVLESYSEQKSLWFDTGKRNAAGDSMWNLIKDSESFGLIPEDYHLSLIDSLVTTAFDS